MHSALLTGRLDGQNFLTPRKSELSVPQWYTTCVPQVS